MKIIDGVMKMIELNNVSFVRQGRTILEAIDWQIKPGEHWVMMGLNGSGKTSILNIIQGQNWPTTGSVKILGETFGKTSIPNLQKRIGWVGSTLNTRINHYQAVEKIILSGIFSTIGVYQKYTESDLEAVDQVMKNLDIYDLKGKKYSECSQGQQQFILIARSLINQPELLILDEPCNGLDLFATEKLLHKTVELIGRESGPTIIFVTHHAEQIMPEFDHTLLLKDGRIFEQGSTQDILNVDKLTAFYDQPVNVVNLDNDRFLVHVK